MSGLPDTTEVFNSVRQALVKSDYAVRYSLFTATKKNLAKMTKNGGCKILQFLCHCRRKSSSPVGSELGTLSSLGSVVSSVSHSIGGGGGGGDDDGSISGSGATFGTYGSSATTTHSFVTTKSSLIGMDNRIVNEVLLESDNNNIGQGTWISQSQLKFILNCKKTDVVLAMSPNHIELASMFRRIEFKHVIGIKVDSNSKRFNDSETATFLEHFYSAILHQATVERAFKLAKAAALSVRGYVCVMKQKAGEGSMYGDFFVLCFVFLFSSTSF